MSQSAAAGDAPQPRSMLAGWLRALGHRRARTYIWLGPTFLFGIFASVFADGLLWPGITITAVTGAVLYATTAMHESALCEACIEATPLDAEHAVQKYRGRLRRIHLFDSHRVLGALFTIVSLGAIPASLVLPPPGGPRVLSVLAVMLLLVFNNVTFLRAEETHAVLEPWCPWCNWGDDGDADQEPSPTPTDLIGSDR